MFPAPPSCCALMNRRCGRLAIASPKAKEVWARMPKMCRTFFELRYSTTISARFVSAIVNYPPYLLGHINSAMRKKQHHVRELTAEARRTPRRGRRKNLCQLCNATLSENKNQHVCHR